MHQMEQKNSAPKWDSFLGAQIWTLRIKIATARPTFPLLLSASKQHPAIVLTNTACGFARSVTILFENRVTLCFTNNISTTKQHRHFLLMQ